MINDSLQKNTLSRKRTFVHTVTVSTIQYLIKCILMNKEKENYEVQMYERTNVHPVMKGEIPYLKRRGISSSQQPLSKYHQFRLKEEKSNLSAAYMIQSVCAGDNFIKEWIQS